MFENAINELRICGDREATRDSFHDHQISERAKLTSIYIQTHSK